jgi:hypothetical protein
MAFRCLQRAAEAAFVPGGPGGVASQRRRREGFLDEARRAGVEVDILVANDEAEYSTFATKRIALAGTTEFSPGTT